MREMSAAIDARRAVSLGLSLTALARVQRSTVALVGLGQLGGALLPHFAMLGIGMVLVDFDLVATENLANQSFSTVDVGEPKASVRARQARALSPRIEVDTLVARVESLGLARLSGAALIIAAVDSYSARVYLNECAVRLGVPLLDLAVDGSGARELGTVTLYDPARAGPCLLCASTRIEHATRLERERPQACPSFRDPVRVTTLPTLATSAHGAVVAGFAVQWALRALVGEIDDLVGSRIVAAGGVRPRIGTYRIARNESCLHDHASYGPPVPVAEPGVDATLTAAARHLGGPVTSARFPSRSFVTGFACACGAITTAIGVLGSAAMRSVHCERCGSRALEPNGVASVLGSADLERARTHTWAELGVPSFDLAEIASATGRAWFTLCCTKEVSAS